MDQGQGKYYRLSLLDCSTPSFATFSKAYYGTMEDIRVFKQSLAATRTGECPSSLESALDIALGGNTSVNNPDLYWDEALILPVTVIGKANATLHNHTWVHFNIWDCPTEMQCDRVETEHLWIVDGENYIRAMFVRFDGLRRQTYNGEFKPISTLWGHPGVITVKAQRRYANTLAITEKRFGSEMELVADMELFPINHDIDFSGFCDDIMGNG